MTTTRKTIIEKIQDEFWITTYFYDGYTSPNVYPKTYKTLKGAEKELNRLNEISK